MWNGQGTKCTLTFSENYWRFCWFCLDSTCSALSHVPHRLKPHALHQCPLRHSSVWGGPRAFAAEFLEVSDHCQEETLWTHEVISVSEAKAKCPAQTPFKATRSTEKSNVQMSVWNFYCRLYKYDEKGITFLSKNMLKIIKLDWAKFKLFIFILLLLFIYLFYSHISYKVLFKRDFEFFT